MFSARIPTAYVPVVERAILNALQGVPFGGDWEVVILPAAHHDSYLLTGESDETPTIRKDEDDNG